MYCERCGTEVPENATSCPNCGMAVPGVQPAPQQPAQPTFEPYAPTPAPAQKPAQPYQKSKAYGLIAFVLSLIAFVGGFILCTIVLARGAYYFNPTLIAIFAIPALVFGLVGFLRAKAEGTNKLFALLGIIFSGVAIFYTFMTCWTF